MSGFAWRDGVPRCARCGVRMKDAKTRTRRYCRACRDAVDREQARDYHRMRRARERREEA